jgi:hypothetical protein
MGPLVVLFLGADEGAEAAVDSLSLTTARCSISLRFILSSPKWSASSWDWALARNSLVEVGFSTLWAWAWGRGVLGQGKLVSHSN